MLEEGNNEGFKQGDDSKLVLCSSKKSIIWFVVNISFTLI